MPAPFDNLEVSRALRFILRISGDRSLTTSDGFRCIPRYRYARRGYRTHLMRYNSDALRTPRQPATYSTLPDSDMASSAPSSLPFLAVSGMRRPYRYQLIPFLCIPTKRPIIRPEK